MNDSSLACKPKTWIAAMQKRGWGDAMQSPYVSSETLPFSGTVVLSSEDWLSRFWTTGFFFAYGKVELLQKTTSLDDRTRW
mmetsp:Transcript_43496/g.105444  ORF Transcript_43496/g.105444 Transcript_43496/m.105444 type:complete len:81 (-) Transcript_43496:241-483(-)